MPKVTLTDTKGLVQSKGSGLDVKNTATFTGNVDLRSATVQGSQVRTAIALSDLGGNPLRLELSGSQSGRTWVLGDNGTSAVWCVVIPTGSVGWTGRFMLTGSQANNNAYLTGSTGIGGGNDNKANTPFAGRVTALNDTTSLTVAGGITIKDGDAGGGAAKALVATAVTFVQGTAVAGDSVDVEVISDGVVKVTGIAST